jgi:glycosyltransferase involved in cell wall biosynthesis
LPVLVTAVITTRARPLHVAEALASVHAETYEDVECVVVDDDGTFDPGSVRLDKPIRVLRGEMAGVAHARNVGLAAARGEFVIFLDDDDVALPNRISTLVDTATRNHADLAFGMTRRSSVVLPSVPTHLASFGAVGFCDILTCAPHINAVLVRTEALRAAGGFDADASHFDDWSAWLRLVDRNAAMCSIPDVVAEWRIHAAGLSAEVLQVRAMKSRLLSLFDRLHAELSEENAEAVSIARRAVAAAEVLTYDDYVEVIAVTRQAMHGDGRCFGRRLPWHVVMHDRRAPETGRRPSPPR